MEVVRSYYGKKLHSPGVHFEKAKSPRSYELPTGVPVFLGFGKAIKKEDVEIDDSVVSSFDGSKVFQLTSWEEFKQRIRVDVPYGFLDYAVRGFFENGGEVCNIILLEMAGADIAPADVFEKVFNEHGPLEDLENIDLVCAPDIMAYTMEKEIDKSVTQAARLQQQMLDYCRRMGDRFAVIDGFPLETATLTNQKIIHFFLNHIRKISHKGRPAEGAMYAPWIRVRPLDRHNSTDSKWVPPCGHVAGIYARSDRMFGFHKAPANEIVVGAIDLKFDVSGELQAALNNMGVNCLRSFPGRGIRVWGARTLSSQLNWKYLNVRRLFITLVRWIMLNLNDMLFEPNEPSLWDNVTDRIVTYCYELYQRGALKGLSADDAFFVRCDAETNPIEVREAGQLICEIGLAPVVPAEFVVVRIVKTISGTTVTLPTEIQT